MLLDLNRISISIKIYLMNNLQSDLIIDMNVLNKDDIDLLFSRQALKIKNIEISLCYTSSSSSVNQSNCFISSVNEYEKNYYFYHFVACHTNDDDVIKQKTRKWKLIFSILFDLQNLQNSINHMTMQLFTTSNINESKNSILVKIKCVQKTFDFTFFKVSRQCRRFKQHFISKNLLHKHIQHCSKDIKECKQTAMTEKWRKLWFIQIVNYWYFLLYTDNNH